MEKGKGEWLMKITSRTLWKMAITS